MKEETDDQRQERIKKNSQSMADFFKDDLISICNLYGVQELFGTSDGSICATGIEMCFSVEKIDLTREEE